MDLKKACPICSGGSSSRVKTPNFHFNVKSINEFKAYFVDLRLWVYLRKIHLVIFFLLKRWLIRIMGFMTHQRYKGFNTLEIEGSDIIRNLPENNVLFVSNHQTYFADVVAMFHVFNASLSGRDDSIKNVGYLWRPKLNMYYVAAAETMKKSLLTKILAYAGSISVERTWRSEGENVNRQVKMSDISNIGKALE